MPATPDAPGRPSGAERAHQRPPAKHSVIAMVALSKLVLSLFCTPPPRRANRERIPKGSNGRIDWSNLVSSIERERRYARSGHFGGLKSRDGEGNGGRRGHARSLASLSCLLPPTPLSTKSSGRPRRSRPSRAFSHPQAPGRTTD